MGSKTALPYEAIFGYVYAVFRLNLCLLAAGLPVLLAFAFTGSQIEAWPFFTALAALCGPAVTAAFAACACMGEETDRVGRVFWSAYRAAFARSLAVAAVAAAAVIVLGVDLEAAAGTPARAVIPMLAALIAVVVLMTTAMLASGRRLSAAGLLACAYLSIRKWYLSLANLAVLGVLLAAIVGKPVLGLAVLPGPALYVVWANTRHIVASLTTTDTGLG
ncbi:DUF624 domain-containing protein [Actinospica robiniae]|uniref:DUF624 domain-containing protein n=1 Tax=Actinospica robiniae TaxID=304901 RepID=UPI0004245026|nr:hypothetical protein [Actinospica robiniae]